MTIVLKETAHPQTMNMSNASKQKQTSQQILNACPRVLTSRGYAIRKDSLTTEQQQQIRKELTVAPQTQGNRGPQGQPFTIYFESPLRFYLPRHWARDVFGPEEAFTMPEGLPLPPEAIFTGKPFDYQEAIIQTFFDADSNGLLCVPCGKGKTFMALAIAARLKKRFLVLVDKEFLLNQWKGEMEAFFPGLRIGILQGPRVETNPEEYDCTICMIQSLVKKEYPEDTFRSYGLSIFDECHHLGASNFSQALLKVQTKHLLGLSATPTRDDGLTKVFEWYLGKPCYWEKQREADTTVSVKALMFSCDDPIYNDIPRDTGGDVITARLLTHVIECVKRNDWIIDQILDLLKHPARRILVLGERIKQLEYFETALATQTPLTRVGYYIGGMKEAVREEAGANAKVLLATYAMASEAMNIKSLNCVILASPRKKVEQSVGRILRERPSERKVNPLIVDVIDSHSTYIGQWRKRKQFYKDCGYKITLQKYQKDSTSEESESEQEAPQQRSRHTSSEPVFGFVDDS
jgi:superfamily II DNA or RNA helicase